MNLGTWSRDLNGNFTLDNCLFKAVKLTKNADPDKYGYNGYGIGFDTCSRFLLTASCVKILLYLVYHWFIIAC